MALVDNAWYVNGSTGVTVYDLGNSTGAAGATLTLTGITVPTGALIVVCINEAVATTDGTFSDGGTNTYTKTAATTLSNTAGRALVFYIWNAVALNNATFTFTKAGSGHATAMTALYATGIQTSSDPRDTTFQATTAVNTTTPTVTSGTPTASNEFVIGFLAWSNAGAKTYSQDNTHNFNAPLSNTVVQPTASVGGGHLNVNGSLAVTFSPSISGASDTAAILLAFTAASTPVGWWNMTKWAASHTQHCGDLIRTNATVAIGSERAFVCIASTSGTGTTAASEPAWTFTRGVKITDNTVTWQEATGIAALNGDLSANTPTWATVKNTAVTLGQVIQNVAGTLVLICTTSGTAGNGAEPSWAAFTNAGATTADNTVTWTTLGTSFSAWSAPHARLGNSVASTWGKVSNKFFVGDNHAETQTSAYTITFPGAQGTFNFVYCVDHTASVPPGSGNLLTTATVTTTGNNSLTINGSAYVYGITFSCGSGANGPSYTLANTNTSWMKFEACALNSLGTSTSTIGVGTNNSKIELWNTTFSFGATGTNIQSTNNWLYWRNTASAIVGATLPTTLFGNGFNCIIDIDGVDLSALGSGKTIISSGTASSGLSILRNVKLGSSVTVASTPTLQGGRIDLIRGDSSGTNYRHERYLYQGTQTVETTITRTGGASDGTTPISWKIITTANSKWLSPFESHPIAIWNDLTGSHTITIYGTTPGGGVPNNDDIWIEVEYLGDASSPLSSFQSTTKANNLASSTTTNNSSDSSIWGGSGAGNGFKMVTPLFTVNQKGYLFVTVKVAKASSTYYIDPLIIIT